MIHSNIELKAKLQSLLEQGHVNEAFVEDIRDLIMITDDTVPELFPGTIDALNDLTITAKDLAT